MDLHPWLGPTGPEDFSSIQEIEDYFDNDNLLQMFPEDGEVDEDEAERAKNETIRQWKESRNALR